MIINAKFNRLNHRKEIFNEVGVTFLQIFGRWWSFKQTYPTCYYCVSLAGDWTGDNLYNCPHISCTLSAQSAHHGTHVDYKSWPHNHAESNWLSERLVYH